MLSEADSDDSGVCGDMTILNEISNWKLESADEDSERYFFHPDNVDLIESGERVFAIGRKGTGKTAVCNYFEGKKKYNVFSFKLSFKNFPFNELYKLKDYSYTRPSQYASLWKYIMYSFICRAMVTNPSIDANVRSKLEKLYPSTAEANFDRLIRN